MAGGGGGGGPGGGGIDPTAIHDGGDAFGSDISVGTIDAFDLILQVGGVGAWKIDHTSRQLIPVDDGIIGIGTRLKRVGDIECSLLEAIVASPASVNYGVSGSNGFVAGDGATFDWFMGRISPGVMLIPTGAKLQQTDAPTVGADLVNKTYADSLVSSGGGWTKSSGVVHLTTGTDPVCIGVSTVVAVEAGAENKFHVEDDYATHATWIFDNPNTGVEAYGSLMSVNEDGVGASVTSFGKHWDGSGNAAFVAGDAGLLYQTIKGIDPAAGAGLVLGNGIGPIKFFSGNGGVYTEIMRVVPGAYPGVAIGTTTLTGAHEQFHVSGVSVFDTGFSYFAGGLAVPKTATRAFLVQTDSSAADVFGVDTTNKQIWVETASADATDHIYSSHSAADLSSIHSNNPNPAGLGCVKVTSDVAGYGVFVAGGSAFSSGGFDTSQVGIASLGMSGGIVIMTQDSTPVRIRTNEVTRLQIDGDGKTGFYGHATAAQQTITGSRSGNAALADLLTKLALTGIIVDGSSA